MTSFSVKKPFTVFVAVVAILVFGVMSYVKMTPDLMPNMDSPYVVVVTTYPCAAPEELPRKYSEAELAFAAARGRAESTVCVYDDLSADFILQYIPDDAVRRLEERLLGACTAAERAEVMAAVRLYFRYEGDAARAARELYVHKNTVYHRIRRVQELTGYSLQRPSEAVLLYILAQRSK